MSKLQSTLDALVEARRRRREAAAAEGTPSPSVLVLTEAAEPTALAAGDELTPPDPESRDPEPAPGGEELFDDAGDLGGPLDPNQAGQGDDPYDPASRLRKPRRKR